MADPSSPALGGLTVIAAALYVHFRLLLASARRAVGRIETNWN